MRAKVTVTTFKVKVCKQCGCEISDALCSYACKWDADYYRPEGTVTVETYERTDRLIKEEVE